MMSALLRGLTAAAVAVSLCAVSTAAIAAAPAAPVAASPAAVTSAPSDPWLALSAMTTSSSAASAAAAQGYDDGVGFPPWPALAVILATIAVGIYIVAKDDDDTLDFESPISPF